MSGKNGPQAEHRVKYDAGRLTARQRAKKKRKIYSATELGRKALVLAEKRIGHFS